MAKEIIVLTTRMGDPRSSSPQNTLERHLDVRQLPELLADGWVMVSASPPDDEGTSRITLERDAPGKVREGQ